MAVRNNWPHEGAITPLVNIKSLYIEVHRNPRSTGLFDRWVASWRPQDDPTYYQGENCAGSDGPTEVVGWSRQKAINNATAALQERVRIEARKRRLEADADDSFERIKVEIDMTPLAGENGLYDE